MSRTGVRDSSHSGEEIAEAAESLLLAVLSQFADDSDETVIPFRRFFTEIGRLCKVELMTGEIMALPEEMTLGELRGRMRAARAALAQGERP